MSAARIGIDLGGTKIELLALGAGGRELWRRRVATPQGDYDATLAAVRDLVLDAEARLALRATVGVGIPGSLSPATGRVRNANSTCLNGRPLKEDLERALGRAVRVENDANCFAVSEAADGAAQGCAVVFGVILGTGVGGGLVANGRLLRGANGIAGEWGHNPLAAPPPVPRCWCGRSGCVETWLSGPGFAADHARAADGEWTAERVVAAMRAGDPVAAASFDRYARRLARALAAVINVVDPDAIVLGGGLSAIDELYERVPRLWGEHVFSDVVRTPLLRNRHGDSSGVRGAAWLWP